jgi:hypothetical protein
LASAKQIAQDRLQRAVRSMLAREVCVECDPQMPQRSGHSFPMPSTGFANPSPSPKFHRPRRRYISTSEKMTSVNVP